MPPEERHLFCPHCGNELDVTDIPPDMMIRCPKCENVFGQSESEPPESSETIQDAEEAHADLTDHAPKTVAINRAYFDKIDQTESQQIKGKLEQEEIVRTATCPHCETLVRVEGFDPLDEVTCPACDKKFELLREFGPFVIKERLDVGGLAVVYSAHDLRNGNSVALKVLSDQAMLEPGSRDSFKREYALTRKLRHENLIQVLEYGNFQGYDYLALELATGMTVARIMHQLPPVRPPDESGIPKDFDMKLVVLPELVCLEIMLQSAAGLGAAHEQGLVHGDVKPANLMITKKGVVKVLDFGLIQFANVEQLFAEAEQHQIFGTAFYIPPERVRGEKEDFRSDIYSLGASLFHMLTGRAPFYAKTLEQIVIMHVQDPLTMFRGKPVVRFSVNAPPISPYTVHIIEKALKKNPNERYMSHAEFIADLTLAKNQLLQSMGKRINIDRHRILKDFLNSVPHYGLLSSFWNQVKVFVNHATSAITAKITKKIPTK